jgi:hypothetical protein
VEKGELIHDSHIDVSMLIHKLTLSTLLISLCGSGYSRLGKSTYHRLISTCVLAVDFTSRELTVHVAKKDSAFEIRDREADFRTTASP